MRLAAGMNQAFCLAPGQASHMLWRRKGKTSFGAPLFFFPVVTPPETQHVYQVALKMGIKAFFPSSLLSPVNLPVLSCRDMIKHPVRVFTLRAQLGTWLAKALYYFGDCQQIPVPWNNSVRLNQDWTCPRENTYTSALPEIMACCCLWMPLYNLFYASGQKRWAEWSGESWKWINADSAVLYQRKIVISPYSCSSAFSHGSPVTRQTIRGRKREAKRSKKPGHNEWEPDVFHSSGMVQRSLVWSYPTRLTTQPLQGSFDVHTLCCHWLLLTALPK